MKLKQFLSTALALVMVFSLSIPVFAADYSTAVSYDGTGTERYVLTVPSQLKPGASGNVTLSGTWASNRHIAVTADKTVAMTGSLGGSETLDITFAGIDLAGDNEAAVSETKSVSVADLDALFGTWTGTFYYNVGASGGSSSGSKNDDSATTTVTDWSSKVKLRNITSDEYDLLCDATNGSNDLMHWNKIYSATDTIYDNDESIHILRGYFSARTSSNYISESNRGIIDGWRPAFEVLTPDTDCSDLSVGDIVIMGTIYVGGTPLKVPTNPVNPDYDSSSDMSAYNKNGSGITSKITLGAALEDTAYQMKAVYVGDGLFVCDRCVLNYITWNQINAALS